MADQPGMPQAPEGGQIAEVITETPSRQSEEARPTS